MKKLLLLSVMLLVCVPGIYAQKSKAESALIAQAVNQVVSARKFTFVANRVLTSGGSQSALKQMNTMKISKDTLWVNLPYFGKGGSAADLGQHSNPLQFTTTDFTYKVEINKRGDRVVMMDVKSPVGSDRFTFTLTITDAALAKLLISGNNRTNMNYSGYIQE